VVAIVHDPRRLLYDSPLLYGVAPKLSEKKIEVVTDSHSIHRYLRRHLLSAQRISHLELKHTRAIQTFHRVHRSDATVIKLS
jgi:hypothetical protein